MIKYLGSKRLLVPAILGAVRAVPGTATVLDLFSGTSRVGMALKAAGFRVVANDHNAYATTLARCYVAADREELLADATRLVRELDRLPGREGYFTETFCRRARFFQPKNGARVDAIREAIAGKGLPPELEAVLLVSLMEAADRVDSTTGVQMAYLKEWAPRAFNDLELRVPELLPRARHGKGEAHGLDALDAARLAEVDVAYLDPPYNQHSYLGNYHIWESLVRWDKPEVYGVACKRADCRTRKSPYNSKPQHRAAFADLVRELRANLIVVSFNNEGFQSRPEMERLLAERGRVFVVTKDCKRYVGAQIGIHSPSGDLVGKVSHLRNEEYIYLVATPELTRRVPDVLDRLDRVAQRVTDAGPREKTTVGAFSAAAGQEVRPRMEIVSAVLARGAATREELCDRTRLSSYQLQTALALMIGRGDVSSLGRGRARQYYLVGSRGTDGTGATGVSSDILGSGEEVGRGCEEHHPAHVDAGVPGSARGVRDGGVDAALARGTAVLETAERWR